MEFDEEFTCPVCRDLIVQPTMLLCGHNLCYLCLANSTLATGRRTCPTCQQGWQGHPAINLALRNMTARMHGGYLAERQQTLSDANAVAVLRSFSQALDKTEKKRKDDQTRSDFVIGMFFAACIILVSYMLYYWCTAITYSADPVTEKPVMTWRSSDVAVWLDNMGWTRNYSAYAHQHEIDGPILLGMEETDIVQLFNVTDTVHQNALQVAIQNLRETGLSMPETLWEYMELYPGRTFALHLCVWIFPRSTMVFVYWFYYDELFLPFLQTTTPVEWGEQPETQWGTLPDPKTSQWIMFTVWTLMLPLWKVALYAWAFRGQHYLLLVPVLLRCAWSTYLDVGLFFQIRGLWRITRVWRDYKQSVVGTLTLIILLLIAWPVIPKFALNWTMFCLMLAEAALVIFATCCAVKDAASFLKEKWVKKAQ